MAKLTAEKVRQLRQEQSHERYSLRAIVEDFFYNLVHLSRRTFFYSAWQLTIQPGNAIRNVLAGYRKSLFDPLEYLVFIGAIVVILTERYHFYSNDLSGQLSKLGFLASYKVFLEKFFSYAEQYATLVNVVSIPVFSAVCRLLFRRSPYNAGEMLVMNTYITAQQMLFLVVLVPFFEFFPGFKAFILPVYTFLAMAYNVWVYVQFFGGKWLPTLLKSVFAVIIGYLLQFPVNLLVYFAEPLLKYWNF